MFSLHFFCQVLHSEKWANLQRTWQRLFLFGVWALGALVALPVVFLLMEVQTEEERTAGCSCQNMRVRPELEAVYIFYTAFSYVVLLFFYVLLVRGVKRNQMPKKKQPRVTWLFIRIIAVSLVVGFFPLVLRVVYVAALFTKSSDLLRVSKMLTFVECFYFFNYCLNPFLYFFASRHQRREGDAKRKSLLMPLNDFSTSNTAPTL